MPTFSSFAQQPNVAGPDYLGQPISSMEQPLIQQMLRMLLVRWGLFGLGSAFLGSPWAGKMMGSKWQP